MEEQTSPFQEWYRNEYLNSQEWKEISERVRLRQPYCLCGNPSTEVHHLYYRKNKAGNLEPNEFSDLVALCHECHSLYHTLDNRRNELVRGERLKIIETNTLSFMWKFLTWATPRDIAFNELGQNFADLETLKKGYREFLKRNPEFDEPDFECCRQHMNTQSFYSYLHKECILRDRRRGIEDYILKKRYGTNAFNKAIEGGHNGIIPKFGI